MSPSRKPCFAEFLLRVPWVQLWMRGWSCRPFVAGTSAFPQLTDNRPYFVWEHYWVSRTILFSWKKVFTPLVIGSLMPTLSHIIDEILHILSIDWLTSRKCRNCVFCSRFETLQETGFHFWGAGNCGDWSLFRQFYWIWNSSACRRSHLRLWEGILATRSMQ